MKKNTERKYIDTVLIVLLLLLAVACIIAVICRNNQSRMSMPVPLTVSGEYSYDGNKYIPLDEKSNISANDGEFIIKCNLSMDVAEGIRINFYQNHIGVSAYVNGELIYMDAKTEISKLGLEIMDSMCGSQWDYILSPGITTSDEVEIHLINCHEYGNEAAYEEFINTLCLTPDVDEILDENFKTYRIPILVVCVSVLVVSVMLLGGAVASAVLQNKGGNNLIKFGFLTLFAGGYIFFDAAPAFSFPGLVAVNTYGKQICMMLSVYFLGLIIRDNLKGKQKKIAQVVMVMSALLDSMLILLACIDKVLIFDTLIFWVISQYIICSVLLVCCVVNIIRSEKKNSFLLISGLALLLTIILDMSGVGQSMYSQGTCTKIVFVILLLINVAQCLKRAVLNQHAVMKVEMLETELAEKKIAIMLSQIKPHFIYNTLGTIGQLCIEAPEKAADLVQKFSLYLRGNFSELDSSAPIRLSKEMEHVKNYVAIEQIRFPDMKVEYDLKSDEFFLPALSVQPLVENAIKHGLMGLEAGGKVTVSTYETDKEYCVSVQDNGVGFEETAMDDGRKHVGINNIRVRIEAMCNGKLTIESTPGKGTTALITIPK